MSPSEPHFPVRLAPDPWNEDLARTTRGRTIAQAARGDYELNGIPRSHLKPCDDEGRDGTHPHCFKVYLPRPDGRFGMVFAIDRQVDEPAFVFLAFGIRHHPKGSHALNVYEIADRRLNARD